MNGIGAWSGQPVSGLPLLSQTRVLQRITPHSVPSGEVGTAQTLEERQIAEVHGIACARR